MLVLSEAVFSCRHSEDWSRWLLGTDPDGYQRFFLSSKSATTTW